MNFLAELRKRNVFRVLAAYLVGAWIIMQVIGFVASAAELPGWIDSFVLIVVLLGLPIVGIAAWALELTPDGIKSSGTETELAPRPIGPVDYVLIAAVVAVVGLFGWQQMAGPAPTVVVEAPVVVAETIADTPVDAEPLIEDEGPEPGSIAVLAFADLSPDGDQEYFSDGISEELLNVLVRVEGLQVASRTSAFRFKGSNAAIPEIAAALNVRHVVEGSVRKAGDTIRVTAQLIDSANDRHLWSQTYDRDLSAQSVFEIQDEIATAIVAALSEALEGVLGPVDIEVEATTDNLTAYELFLQARPLFLARDDLDVADGYLAQAVALDPEFSEAWEMRGALYMLAAGYGFIEGDSDYLIATAHEYTQRALDLEPDSSMAIAVSTFLETIVIEIPNVVQLRQSIEGFSRALEIDPRNTSALNWRGLMYMSLGYFQQAMADHRACVEIEPHYIACRGNLAFAYAALGDDQAAYESVIETARQGMPLTEIGIPIQSLARLGKQDIFYIFASQILGVEQVWGDHDVLYEMFRNPQADFGDLVEEIAALAETGDPAADNLGLDIMLGNYSRADERLVPVFGAEWVGFRASDRYQELLQSSVAAEYWRLYGFPPMCREIDDGRIDCDY